MRVLLLLGCWSLMAQEGLVLEKEAALGKRLAEDVRRQTTAVDAPGAQRYVERLAERIAAELQGSKLPFTFSLVTEDSCQTIHEPVVLPGGYVFVSAALFAAAEDESEFAGMLAHAIVHVVEGPWPRPAVKAQGLPLIFLGGWSGKCSAGLAVPLAYLESQRKAERDADALVVGAMARAGFDPQALARYIDRVQPAASKYSPLPDREDRLTAIRSEIGKLARVDYKASGAFASVKEEVRRLAEPVRPRTVPSLIRK
jgi:predicted Zn-dependent protease